MEILEANVFSKSEKFLAQYPAQESPAMCLHGNGPGMSTATQRWNVALGEIVRERAQQQEEMAPFQEPAGLGIHRK